MTVTGVAANAGAGLRILFVDHDPQRNVKRIQPRARKIFGQVLNARLVTHRWVSIRSTGPRFGWVFTAIAVNVIEVFSLSVIWLHLVIANGPPGRDAAVMANLSKVFFAQAEQSRAVEFCIAPN